MKKPQVMETNPSNNKPTASTLEIGLYLDAPTNAATKADTPNVSKHLAKPSRRSLLNLLRTILYYHKKSAVLSHGAL